MNYALPPEPAAGEPLRASWGAALLRWCRANTLTQTPGMLLSRSANGTSYRPQLAPRSATSPDLADFQLYDASGNHANEGGLWVGIMFGNVTPSGIPLAAGVQPWPLVFGGHAATSGGVGTQADGLSVGGLSGGGLSAGGLSAGGLSAGGLSSGGLSAGGLSSDGGSGSGGGNDANKVKKTYEFKVTATGSAWLKVTITDPGGSGGSGSGTGDSLGGLSSDGGDGGSVGDSLGGLSSDGGDGGDGGSVGSGDGEDDGTVAADDDSGGGGDSLSGGGLSGGGLSGGGLSGGGLSGSGDISGSGSGGGGTGGSTEPQVKEITITHGATLPVNTETIGYMTLGSWDVSGGSGSGSGSGSGGGSSKPTLTILNSRGIGSQSYATCGGGQYFDPA